MGDSNIFSEYSAHGNKLKLVENQLCPLFDRCYFWLQQHYFKILILSENQSVSRQFLFEMKTIKAKGLDKMYVSDISSISCLFVVQMKNINVLMFKSLYAHSISFPQLYSSNGFH